jgi:tetratricopeptide (TPR) repeat protein
LSLLETFIEFTRPYLLAIKSAEVSQKKLEGDMKKIVTARCVLMFISILWLLFITNGVSNPDEGGKIPISTTSDEAKEAFLQGRNLFEKLRIQESRRHFEQAVSKDPNFALGYFFLANSQPTPKGFFEYREKAVSLADKASEGERLWILGAQAATTGNPAQQGELYKKLCEVYPNDERAHTLLGTYYFGLQDYPQAIEQYEKAAKINPEYSQLYNQLGYSYRFLEKYEEAENAFKKYVELIPDDPNPYDSYAELLMKIGRYDESIPKYQEALKVNPNFVASHIGIATNLNFKGKYEEGRQQLQKLYDMARDDGERRAAYFAMAVSYADQGNLEEAMNMIKKQYEIAEKINDAAAMSGDLVAMGKLLMEKGGYEKALEKYQKATTVVQESNLSDAVKANNKRFSLYNLAYADLRQNDMKTAKAKAEELRKAAYDINNRFLIRLAHQISGMIALEEKQFDKALEELQQASQQNPYNLYRMALAYEGKGDRDQAIEMYKKVANQNTLNSMNYAFVRNQAKQKVAAN